MDDLLKLIAADDGAVTAPRRTVDSLQAKPIFGDDDEDSGEDSESEGAASPRPPLPLQRLDLEAALPQGMTNLLRFASLFTPKTMERLTEVAEGHGKNGWMEIDELRVVMAEAEQRAAVAPLAWWATQLRLCGLTIPGGKYAGEWFGLPQLQHFIRLQQSRKGHRQSRSAPAAATTASAAAAASGAATRSPSASFSATTPSAAASTSTSTSASTPRRVRAATPPAPASLQHVLANEDNFKTERNSSHRHRQTSDHSRGCCCTPASRIAANSVLLSLAFFSMYTAFGGLQNLETSLIAVPNVGAMALAVLYLVFTAVCLAGPLIVATIGPRVSLLCGFLALALFCVANAVVAHWPENIYLAWISLIGAAALVGIAASPLWISQALFITADAKAYAKATKDRSNSNSEGGDQDHDRFLGTFNGTFWLFFHCTQISGNLLASAVPIVTGGEIAPLFYVYLAFAFIGVLLALGVRRPRAEPAAASVPLLGSEFKDHHVARSSSISSINSSTNGDDAAGDLVDDSQPPSCCTTLLSTATICLNPNMLLLIPLAMHTGLQLGFVTGEFTSQFVTPLLGAENIGWVMLAFGICDALGSFVLGSLSDCGRFARMGVILTGACVQGAALLALATFSYGVWVLPPGGSGSRGTNTTNTTMSSGSHALQSSSTSASAIETGAHALAAYKWIFCLLVAGAWGVGDAAFSPQLTATLGSLFDGSERIAAFASNRLFQSITRSAIFFLHPVGSVDIKLMVLFITLGLGVLAYLALQFVLARKSGICRRSLSDL